MEQIPFSLKLTGGMADDHSFEGYDGFVAIAGFARTLTLTTHYAACGKLRHRGDFYGRHAVTAEAPSRGSVIVDFVVWFEQQQDTIAHLVGGGVGAGFLYALTNHVISRNIGQPIADENDELSQLLTKRPGDIEALIAATEAPVRRAHDVIGNGASEMSVLGGFNVLNQLNHQSKDYISSEIEDLEEVTSQVSVAAYNANQGTGAVFDFQEGRLIPFSMNAENKEALGVIFTWGLDQYANGTGAGVNIVYTRTLSNDGRPKRYKIKNAYH